MSWKGISKYKSIDLEVEIFDKIIKSLPRKILAAKTEEAVVRLLALVDRLTRTRHLDWEDICFKRNMKKFISRGVSSETKLLAGPEFVKKSKEAASKLERLITAFEEPEIVGDSQKTIGWFKSFLKVDSGFLTLFLLGFILIFFTSYYITAFIRGFLNE